MVQFATAVIAAHFDGMSIHAQAPVRREDKEATHDRKSKRRLDLLTCCEDRCCCCCWYAAAAAAAAATLYGEFCCGAAVGGRNMAAAGLSMNGERALP